MVILLVAAAVAALALAFVLLTDGRTFGKRLLLFCLGLLETLPHPGSILGELRRVLAPEGRMVLGLYVGWSATNTTLSLGQCTECCVISVGARHASPLQPIYTILGTQPSLDGYRRHLGALGLDDVRVLPCRRNQDVVVARASFGSPGPDPDRS